MKFIIEVIQAIIAPSKAIQLASISPSPLYKNEGWLLIAISGWTDWTLVNVYADEGKSGTSTKKRTDFKRMTEVRNCISLDNLIREQGSNLYPSTIGKKLSIAELQTRHHQKSHIRLTPVAKSYIDKLFNSLGLKYGLLNFS